MTTRNDRWGEPIDPRRRTYSLATLFRVLTIVAGFCGWLSVVRFSLAAASLVLLVTAVALAIIAMRRTNGGWQRRGLTGALFLVGIPFVAVYLALASMVVAAPAWMHPSLDPRFNFAGLDLVIEACFLLVALPCTTIVSSMLLSTWLHLAADAADREIER
ncbi:MAG: hypothetical protein MUF06_18060 [Pirellulaceae bacterium]|nr:hypothetical protein [Pirellulaceae bacterium]